jgi:hypothetical protein
MPYYHVLFLNLFHSGGARGSPPSRDIQGFHVVTSRAERVVSGLQGLDLVDLQGVLVIFDSGAGFRSSHH